MKKISTHRKTIEKMPRQLTRAEELLHIFEQELAAFANRAQTIIFQAQTADIQDSDDLRQALVLDLGFYLSKLNNLDVKIASLSKSSQEAEVACTESMKLENILPNFDGANLKLVNISKKVVEHPGEEREYTSSILTSLPAI